jgi:hypothetical protein
MGHIADPNLVVAFLSLACAPMPFIFYKYGARLRQNSSYAPSAVVAKIKDVEAGVVKDEVIVVERKVEDSQDAEPESVLLEAGNGARVAA